MWRGDLGAGELGDGLGALGDGVLGQLTRQHQAHSSLDLTRGDGGLLVVASQASRLPSNLVKDVVDEGVEDGHGLGGNARVGVHLLQHPDEGGRAAAEKGIVRGGSSSTETQPVP